MEEKTPTFNDAPKDYALCFNKECAQCEKCMHYHIGQLAPEGITRGAAIYPSAYKDGQCRHFAKKEKVQFAWGFNSIFESLPDDMVTKARKALRNHLSNGASTYYRYHNGEKMLSPARQKEITDFMAQFGSAQGFHFDHYVECYDFT